MTLNHVEKHLADILNLAILYTPNQKALVIYDNQSNLAKILVKAYQAILPQAHFINFNTSTAENIFSLFTQLQSGDLVVLIQSTSFRLKDFRIRVELFAQGLKVIEHPHLSRMYGIQETWYIDSLAYDPKYYRIVGHKLKHIIDNAKHGAIVSSGGQLNFASSFELAKLNIGDYTEMKNIGGQFPIGEVFTESYDLEAVHGHLGIFAFGDISFCVKQVDTPIILSINKGRITAVENSTSEFDLVLANIRADEGEIWLRELGLGMNRAFSKMRMVTDIGTYERMCGVHVSLGAKHGVYKKANFKRSETWHHVDVFVDTQAVYFDNKNIFANDEWLIA